MEHFELVSEYKPAGDQPQAIDSLVKGINEGKKSRHFLELQVQERHIL